MVEPGNFEQDVGSNADCHFTLLTVFAKVTPYQEHASRKRRRLSSIISSKEEWIPLQT